MFITACSAVDRTPLGEKFVLYNDPSGATTMQVSPGHIAVYKNGNLFAAAEYSGDLLAADFTMPAGVWANDAVKGSWHYIGYFLEFEYTSPTKDTTISQYIPFTVYQMDWLQQ